MKKIDFIMENNDVRQKLTSFLNNLYLEVEKETSRQVDNKVQLSMRSPSNDVDNNIEFSVGLEIEWKINLRMISLNKKY